MNPILLDFDFIVVNSSGGKDSQTALRYVVQTASIQHFDLNRIAVAHQDLGRMEWPGTKELVIKQAEHYGLLTYVTKYRNALGEESTLLDYVRRRKRWPSSEQRYCTSDFKRGPGGRVITARAGDMRMKGIKVPRILQVFGFRAEESPARAKKNPYALNKLLTRKGNAKIVYDWLPIFEWSTKDVWDDIHQSGVPYHRAYDLGMPRLSCCFCIFAPKAALMIAGRENPELLDEYVALEAEIGHDFQHRKPIRLIKAAIEAGETASTQITDKWNM